MTMHDQRIIIARNLRRKQTKPETLMWQRLRGRQLEGVKFRRQVPIGNYIVDFASLEKKIIIEIDGGQHNFDINKQFDKNRTLNLKNKGFRVLRFWNNEIFENLDGVLNKIRDLILSFS